MRYAVASDHAGFSLKQSLLGELEGRGNEAADLGTYDASPADYPDSARAVSEALLRGEADRGILVCGSGVGASVAANKFPGIRAAICHDTFSARQGVEDDDMNVLCFGARVVGPELAREIVAAFVAAQFSGLERHVRRLEKVSAIEREHMNKRKVPRA